MVANHIPGFHFPDQQNGISWRAEQQFERIVGALLERFFMAFDVYADESGTHDPTGRHVGSEIAAIVGYFAPRENWRCFCTEWESVLNSYGVKVFHLSDLSHGKGEFKHWDDPKKDQFMRELIPVARNNTMFAFGGFLSVKDYDEIVPVWLKDMVGGHPYHFCFRLFLQMTLRFFKQSCSFITASDPVGFFFDLQHEFKKQALGCFYETRIEIENGDRLGSITFDSKDKLIPLQAADLLAGRMRKVFTKALPDGHYKLTPETWDSELCLFGNVITEFFDAESIRMLVHQMETKPKRTVSP
ncbi:MAG: DUF3800 domain-containing protein [Syntrophobacteraceae bacterium]